MEILNIYECKLEGIFTLSIKHLNKLKKKNRDRCGEQANKISLGRTELSNWSSECFGAFKCLNLNSGTKQ